jgi:ATP-binding cassette subfamily C (CFTR/MRP) protein 4
MSNDVNRFDAAVIFLHYLWIGPIQTCVVTYFMWTEVGPSAAIGVISLLIFVPLQGDNFSNTNHVTFKMSLKTLYLPLLWQQVPAVCLSYF